LVQVLIVSMRIPQDITWITMIEVMGCRIHEISP
jgi:hypothetical protein